MNAIRILTRKTLTQNRPLAPIKFSSNRIQERDSRAVRNSVEEQARWSEGMVLSQVDAREQLQASGSQVDEVTTGQAVVDRHDQEEGRGVSAWRHEIRDFERQL